MLGSVRQNVLQTIIGVFLAGNFLLAALLWNSRGNAPLGFAASGALVAEPLLLAVWLGFARQPIVQRLKATVGLSLVAAITYALGIVVVDRHLKPGVYILFMFCGVGVTVLAGGFFRAHRVLFGVLMLEPTSAKQIATEQMSTAHAAAEHAAAGQASPAVTDPLDIPATSPFDEVPSPESSAPAVPSTREFQFGVGYLIAMTSAIAIVISVLRWIAAATDGPSWPMLFLFGWTFFVYSTLAALVTVVSILSARHQRTLAPLALACTLLAPVLTLPIISVWEVSVMHPAALVNLYSYAFGLALTIALVAYILRRLGYRLRHGWLNQSSTSPPAR